MDNLAVTLGNLQEMGMQIIGLDADGDIEYSDVNLTEPTVIVIGSEGEGMTRRVTEACDQLVSIPLKGSISSLNASVAAGVVCFEAVRQRSA